RAGGRLHVTDDVVEVAERGRAGLAAQQVGDPEEAAVGEHALGHAGDALAQQRERLRRAGAVVVTLVRRLGVTEAGSAQRLQLAPALPAQFLSLAQRPAPAAVFVRSEERRVGEGEGGVL